MVVSKSWFVALALALMLCVAGAEVAQCGGVLPLRLLGTTGMGSTPSNLVELDPATGGLIQTIGPVGYTVNGLAYDYTTGTLYGSTSFSDPNYHGLITIDMTTGAGTVAGVDGWNAPGGGPVVCVCVSPTGQMFAWTENSDNLVVVDKSTGVATVVGASGVGTYQQGLAFDAAGVLHLVNGGGDHYTMDTTTGLAAWVNGGYYSVAHHGVFDPATGYYIGIDTTGFSSKNLLVLDLTNALSVGATPTVDNLHTLAFAGEVAPTTTTTSTSTTTTSTTTTSTTTTSTTTTTTIPAGAGTGLRGRYCKDIAQRSPVFERTDPVVDFNWFRDAPARRMPKNHFSICWTGFVQPPYSEAYTFTLTADDGARLYINGELIIDRWTPGDTPWSDSYTFSTPFVSGQKYSIRLDYREIAGDAQVHLYWSCPRQPMDTIIPQNYLYPR